MQNEMEIILESKVKMVTVFPNRARVIITGQVELEAGNLSLVFDELPLALLPESVRASGKGTAKVRIVGVDVRRIHYEQTPKERVRELEAQIENLEDELKILQDEKAVLASQGKYLDGLREATEHFARGLAFGRTKVADQAALAESIKVQDLELRSATRELEKRSRELERSLDRLQRELHQLWSARPKERFQAIIELSVAGSGSFEPEISYDVDDASWRPLYDMRLIEGDDGHLLKVFSLAEVSQMTGQDWEGVRLTVSTARPALTQRVPDLKPWFINEYKPPVPLPRTMRASMAAPAAEVTPMETSLTGLREAEVAEYVEAVVEDVDAVVHYVVPGGVDIPGDGMPHKVALSSRQFQTDLDYLTIPKHTDVVYRRVKAIYEGPGPLLPGQTSLFVGEEYIGTTEIKFLAAGDELELLLGVEDRIFVKRELVRREVDKALLRDRRQLQYGYEISVKNHLAEAIKLEVHDHIPVSRSEEIKVKTVSMSPVPAEQSALGILEWHFTLAAGGEVKVEYSFLVEHPRSMQVVGLLD